MNREEMFRLVCDLLRDSPDTEDVEITLETNPFKSLGKDSHDGIVFACLFSERLGVELDPVLNPLVDDQRQCARTVGELVDWCLEHQQTNKKEK